MASTHHPHAASGTTGGRLAQMKLQHVAGILVGIFVLYRIYLVVYRLWFHPLSKFPGPKLMAMSHLPYLWRNDITGSWVWEAGRLHRKYGPIVRTGPERLTVDGSVGWPEVFAHRPGGKSEYPKLPNFYLPGDEQCLLGAPREVHRRQRRLVATAFSDTALLEQEGITKKYINLLVTRLGERADRGEIVNITEWMSFISFDIIGDLTFADPFNSLANNDYHPWVKTMTQGIKYDGIRRFTNFYPILGLLIKLITPRRLAKMIEDHHAFGRQKGLARISLGAEPRDGRRDFMTYILRDNGKEEQSMSREEILANSPIFIGAGSETVSTALAGYFFYLSRSPEVYQILADEIRSTFKSGSDIDTRSTAGLHYLNACIEETLRIYPPIAEMPPRVSPGDTIAGQYVPAGTIISINQHATNHNPESFTDPNAFRPERWLPSTHPRYDARFKNDNRAAFKPFSHGTRDCVGKKLAYAEMRVIIAKILHGFDFAFAFPQENWHKQMAFLAWEKVPLMISLRRRESAE